MNSIIKKINNPVKIVKLKYSRKNFWFLISFDFFTNLNNFQLFKNYDKRNKNVWIHELKFYFIELTVVMISPFKKFGSIIIVFFSYIGNAKKIHKFW